MRNLNHLNTYRLDTTESHGYSGDETCGAFYIGSSVRPGERMLVMASGGRNGDLSGWEHVSVSLPKRTPSWAEMEQVKRLFFEPHEVAMQLHVAEADHISFHPHTLHLWRPLNAEIPLPPSIFVAPKAVVLPEPEPATMDEVARWLAEVSDMLRAKGRG